MDYKKEYEAAFARAKDLHDKHPYGEPPVWTTCEKIFPELKESEDEKIRKGLIKGLSVMRDIHYHQTFSDDAINIDDAIAWLEKQGESNPYSGISFKYNGHTWGMCARDNGVDVLVDEELKSHVSLDEKHAWSEEDEKMCESTIDILVNNTMSGSEGDKVYSEEINWLRSLKPRWKPTEEQMCAFRAVLDSYKMRVNDAVTNCAESLYDDLKSL